MYSIVSTAIIHGIDSILVQVEADVSDGMPMFDMVGFLASEVKEARERVRTALRNCGYFLPAKRITVNLSPANIKKTGSGFDLPVAVAILAALGQIDQKHLSRLLLVGEIGLQGQIQPVQGILPIVAEAGRQGFGYCIVPYENRMETQLLSNINILPVKTLPEVIACLNEETLPEGMERQEPEYIPDVEKEEDFSQINGQRLVRRASEVAAAGMHNFLMIGPPGAGKTMIAKRIPGILPPMQEAEQLELAKIYSVSGLLLEDYRQFQKRPFRSPHHTVTPQGLVGGGSIPKPGEISLAHKGVLFLDELAEFPRNVLELLRQPMEDKVIHLARLQAAYTYPADFMLVAAMNPCPCGFYPDMNRCSCTQYAIDRYLGKISQPLLDRMDICVQTGPVSYEELTGKARNESTADIRLRVQEAWQIQKERFAGTKIYFNSQIPAEALLEFCGLGKAEEIYLQEIYQQTDLTARSYHRLLRVARTIADLAHSHKVTLEHLTEAVCYRSLDKKYWERRPEL